jgi:predicted metal-dependent HD superfamily phosphohydrolase
MNARGANGMTFSPSPACPEILVDRVKARYAEPHRRYHTWEHVLACFASRRCITEANMADVDLALLFHDAVYEPLAHDNEAKSAELLLEEGRRAWLNDRVLVRAARLVESTKHDGTTLPESEEECIVRDSDLSILGESPEVFARYERAVREEYAVIDDATFTRGRLAVLAGFLSLPSIYLTRVGARLWESRARANLEASLAKLERAQHLGG